jgi:hypothetical protein
MLHVKRGCTWRNCTQALTLGALIWPEKAHLRGRIVFHAIRFVHFSDLRHERIVYKQSAHAQGALNTIHPFKLGQRDSSMLP